MHKAGRRPPWSTEVRRSSSRRYKGVKNVAVDAAAADADQNVDGIETKDRKAVSVRRLLRQARPELGILSVATLALFVAAATTLAIPHYFGEVIDSLAGKKPYDAKLESLRKASVGLLVVVIASGFFGGLRGYLYTLAGERVVARLRRPSRIFIERTASAHTATARPDAHFLLCVRSAILFDPTTGRLFDHLIKMEVGFFDRTKSGELVNRLSADTDVLKNVVTINISMALRWFVQILGGVSYLFVLNWKLSLLMIAVIPVMSISAKCYGNYLRKLARKTQDALAEATDVASESIGNVRTVRGFAREARQMALYGAAVQESYEYGARVSKGYGLFIGFMSTVGGGSLISILYYGGSMVLDGDMTPGVLTSYLLYCITISGSLAGFAGVVGQFMSAAGANERVFQLLDRKAATDLEAGATAFRTQEGGNDGAPDAGDGDGDRATTAFRGGVKFDGVTFAYPSRPGKDVLTDVKFEVRAGQTVALVGPSGGGKSTCVNLIERFYEPRQGAIFFDGDVPLAGLQPDWVHHHVGLVRQEPVLFSTSVRDNISFGKPDATEDEVKAAAAMANASEFIDGFPEGYETVVGERGMRLSGGRKQRVAIARAVLMDPQLLLLDEATSALDAESEHLVQEALDRLMKNRTVLVVAHRLSTVRDADCVVVIDRGRVVGQGTHDELMETNRLYAKLVRRQLVRTHGGGVGGGGAAKAGGEAEEVTTESTTEESREVDPVPGGDSSHVVVNFQ